MVQLTSKPDVKNFVCAPEPISSSLKFRRSSEIWVTADYLQEDSEYQVLTIVRGV